MNKIYKLKENVDLNKLAEIGFELLPGPTGQFNFIKLVTQPENGTLTRFLYTRYYKNPDWKEKIYKKNKKEIVKTIGLKYDKEGAIIPNDKFETFLLTWRVEISEDDEYWVGAKSGDPFDNNFYYSAKVLDEHFGEVIKGLKEKDLIEEIEVE